MISRRMALFGLGGTLVLGCGGGLAWLTTGYRAPSGEVALALTPKELVIVRAVVEALLPEDADLPSGLSVGVHQRIDEELWAMPDKLRDDVKSALQVIELLPLLWGHGGRFSRLPLAAREAAFVQMLNAGPTPIVQAANALKQMCTLFYFTSEATWPAIRYDGPWVATPRPPASAVRYAELLAAARRGA